ncbi:hypothetical protein KUCAC02_031831, partial [Chaenocephalus aceratus]
LEPTATTNMRNDENQNQNQANVVAFVFPMLKVSSSFGKPSNKEHSYDGVPITRGVHDNHYCSANPCFIAVVTDCEGGGAFLVLPLHHYFMGPKKTIAAEEVEDIKKSLDFLAEDISAVRLQQKNILDLVKEFKDLRIQNAEKDKRITYLESRVEDLEQYTRMNNVIVTGLNIKPRSYARAVTVNTRGHVQIFRKGSKGPFNAPSCINIRLILNKNTSLESPR